MSHLWDYPDHEPSDAQGSLGDRSRALKALRMMFLEGERVTLGRGEPRYAKRMTRSGDFRVPGLDGANRGEGLGDVESAHSPHDKAGHTHEKVRRSIGIDLRRGRASGPR